MSTVSSGYFALHYPEYIISEKLAEEIMEKLPHGSGINSNWFLSYEPVDGIRADNVFESMNDGGYYCHNWPFYVIIPVVEKFDESGNLLLLDEIDYKDECFGDVVFVNCDPENDCPPKWVVDEYFAQFEKDEFGNYAYEVYDNEPISCGFMLKEYLEDTIYAALKY